jgi:hypothetical protein
MKKEIIISILLLYSISHAFAQHREGQKVNLSIVEHMEVDSIRIFETPLKLGLLKDSAFSKQQLSSPVKTMQTFISVNTIKWGKAIADNNYKKLFPSEELINYRNTKEYRDNAYTNIFFIIYFKYNKERFSGCFSENFANIKNSKYVTLLVFKLDADKWLLTTDWYLSRLTAIKMLKPAFAINLLQGKQMKGNKKYNELLDSVYQNGILDMGVFSTLISEKKEYFSELLNSNKN